jgi:hypothetical protein
LGSVCTRDGSGDTDRAQSLTASLTQTTAVARDSASTATASAYGRSARVRWAACSSGSGALTSSTLGTPAPAAQAVPVRPHSEYRS